MMCPDCGCDLTNSYISCPNCGRELVKIHYKATPQPVPSDEFRESNFGLSSYQNELKRQNDLLERVSPDERVVIENFLSLKNGGKVDFIEMSNTLFEWSKKWIGNTGD
jgi:uncharacterized Zn finger protein (UPF0148 family)